MAERTNLKMQHPQPLRYHSAAQRLLRLAELAARYLRSEELDGLSVTIAAHLDRIPAVRGQVKNQLKGRNALCR